MLTQYTMSYSLLIYLDSYIMSDPELVNFKKLFSDLCLSIPIRAKTVRLCAPENSFSRPRKEFEKLTHTITMN